MRALKRPQRIFQPKEAPPENSERGRVEETGSREASAGRTGGRSAAVMKIKLLEKKKFGIATDSPESSGSLSFSKVVLHARQGAEGSPHNIEYNPYADERGLSSSASKNYNNLVRKLGEDSGAQLPYLQSEADKRFSSHLASWGAAPSMTPIQQPNASGAEDSAAKFDDVESMHEGACGAAYESRGANDSPLPDGARAVTGWVGEKLSGVGHL